MLDGALIRRLSFEQAIADMRRSLQTLDAEKHRRLIAVHHPGPAADVDAALERLLELVASLDKGDWIAGYAHGPGLVARLDGVRRRLGFDRLDEPARMDLAEGMEGLLDRAEPWLDQLLFDS